MMKNNKPTRAFYKTIIAAVFSITMISCATTKNIAESDLAQNAPQPKKYVYTFQDEHSESIYTFTINPDNTYTLHLDELIYSASYFNPEWNFPVVYVNIDFEQGDLKGNPAKSRHLRCDFKKYLSYNKSIMIESILKREYPELLNLELSLEEIIELISPYLKNTGATQEDIDKITLSSSHGYFFLTVMEKLAENGIFEYELTNKDIPLIDYPYVQRKMSVSKDKKTLSIESLYGEFGTQTFTLVE